MTSVARQNMPRLREALHAGLPDLAGDVSLADIHVPRPPLARRLRDLALRDHRLEDDLTAWKRIYTKILDDELEEKADLRGCLAQAVRDHVAAHGLASPPRWVSWAIELLSHPTPAAPAEAD